MVKCRCGTESVRCRKVLCQREIHSSHWRRAPQGPLRHEQPRPAHGSTQEGIIETVYASPWRRATQTARLIAERHALPIQVRLFSLCRMHVEKAERGTGRPGEVSLRGGDVVDALVPPVY
jgi:hypothetical protein